MRLGKHIRKAGLIAFGFAVASCASGDGQVTVDASWNLTCPIDTAVGCGTLGDTCLGGGGERTIVGGRGEIACDDQPIVAVCQDITRPDGERTIFLEASVGSDYAFELRGATIDSENGSVEAAGCTVIIVEDGLAYDIGNCGPEPPSMEQPCQLSNVLSENREVSFELSCRSLLSSATGSGFDVGAVGGGPTTISFSNCEEL